VAKLHFDNDASFVLGQHVVLNLYSASSLRHQSMGRQVAPVGRIIIVPI